MDYKNGKIYRLVGVDGLQYVGSTTQPLYKRLYEHKYKYQRWKNGKYDFVSSFNLIEKGEIKIILIEDYPCERKEQLRSRERYWIENIEGGCVNKLIPARTHEERLENLRVYAKVYREENKDKISEDKKKVIKCGCGAEITQDHKSRHEKTQKHLKWMNK